MFAFKISLTICPWTVMVSIVLEAMKTLCKTYVCVFIKYACLCMCSILRETFTCSYLKMIDAVSLSLNNQATHTTLV